MNSPEKIQFLMLRWGLILCAAGLVWGGRFGALLGLSIGFGIGLILGVRLTIKKRGNRCT